MPTTHDAVEDDREPLAVVRGGVVVEQVGALGLQLDVHGRLAHLVGTGTGGGDLVAAEDGRRVDAHGERLALDDVVRVLVGDRHEVELARGARESTELVDIDHARQLDRDPVAALGPDVRLGHTGRVHAVLDDGPGLLQDLRRDRLLRRSGGCGTRV